MKTKMIRAAIAGAILALSATAAFATVTPSQGTDVGLEHDPEGIIARATTDRDGKIEFRDLKPGNYVLVIDGPSFVASMDRNLPEAPRPKSGGGGLSIGIGGMFGGGGSHRSSTGGTPGGPTGGASHGGSHSGGGLGLGVVPADVEGDGHADSPVRPGHPGDAPGYPITGITISLPSNPDLTIETPYCRDAMSHGMRIGFTVPPNSGSTGNAVSAAITWDAPAGGWQRR